MTGIIDYINILDRKEPEKDASESYNKIKKLSEEMIAEMDKNGQELLSIGIIDGKRVVINQHGKISTKTTYEEYISNVRSEFCKLVDEIKNGQFKKDS